jgi:broad specificity phosphatase PhoE
VPLNQRGMRQAEQLARRLFAHGFVHILCSDFLRARMTAVPLAACSGITIEREPTITGTQLWRPARDAICRID